MLYTPHKWICTYSMRLCKSEHLMTIKHSYCMHLKSAHFISAQCILINIMLSVLLIAIITVSQCLWNAAEEMLTHACVMSNDKFCFIQVRGSVGGFGLKYVYIMALNTLNINVSLQIHPIWKHSNSSGYFVDANTEVLYVTIRHFEFVFKHWNYIYNQNQQSCYSLYIMCSKTLLL